jgi:tripeptidyl-peptidase I
VNMLSIFIAPLRWALVLALFGHEIHSSPARTRSSYSVKDSHPVPRNWECLGRADPEQRIRLRIGLKQHRVGELERHLLESK